MLSKDIFGQNTEQEIDARKWSDQSVVLLRSCSPEQISYEMHDGSNSYFTHYLVRGLAGDADGFTQEKLKKGSVNAADLCAYVKANVAQAVAQQENGQQNPQMTLTDANANVMILTTTSSATPLSLTLTAPAALKQGKELLLKSDAVTIAGMVDDIPGLQLNSVGAKQEEIRLLAGKAPRHQRVFSHTFTSIPYGESRLLIEAYDGQGKFATAEVRVWRFEESRAKKSIAVLPIAVQGAAEKADDAALLAASLQVQFARAIGERAELLERALVDSKLRGTHFELSRVGDNAAVQQVGKNLGANYLLLGTMNPLEGGKARLNLWLLDVGLGKINAGVGITRDVAWQPEAREINSLARELQAQLVSNRIIPPARMDARLVGALDLLLPGAGHCANGDWGRGLGILAGSLALDCLIVNAGKNR